MDLSELKNVYKLYNDYKNRIDFLINNAGFGVCGEFINFDLENG